MTINGYEIPEHDERDINHVEGVVVNTSWKHPVMGKPAGRLEIWYKGKVHGYCMHNDCDAGSWLDWAIPNWKTWAESHPTPRTDDLQLTQNPVMA